MGSPQAAEVSVVFVQRICQGRGRGWLAGLLLGVVLCGVAGCGARTSAPAKSGGPLGPVEPESAVAVDGGRITVASPVGWVRAPRSKDVVIGFEPRPRRTDASIVVVGADPPKGLEEVTGANHAAFLESISSQLAKNFTKDGKSTLLVKPRAVLLGTQRAVAWKAPGKAKIDNKSVALERSCYAVVVAGRMYTVEARATKGRQPDSDRAAARGVAASIVVAPPAPPTPEPPAEPSAPEPPAPAPTTKPAPPPAPAEPAPAEPAPAEPAPAEPAPAATTPTDGSSADERL